MKALIRMTNLKKYIWFTVVKFFKTSKKMYGHLCIELIIDFKLLTCETAINKLKKSIIFVI